MSTIDTAIESRPTVTDEPRHRARGGAPARVLLLAIGAFVFVFPFYYMFIGSFQKDADNGHRRRGATTRATSRPPTTATSTTPST